MSFRVSSSNVYCIGTIYNGRGRHHIVIRICGCKVDFELSGNVNPFRCRESDTVYCHSIAFRRSLQLETDSRGKRDILQVHSLAALHTGSLGIHKAGIHIRTYHILTIFFHDVTFLLVRHVQCHGTVVTAQFSSGSGVYGIEISHFVFSPTHTNLSCLVQTGSIVLCRTIDGHFIVRSADTIAVCTLR